MDELVTIITPTFNHAKYLEETIESVLSQDYRNLEYIVLNDGSTDNTKEILDSLHVARLKVIHQDNMGEVATVNKGYELANGKMICVVNSDDPILPKLVSTAVETFEKNPQVGVVYPDWIMIGERDDVLYFDKRNVLMTTHSKEYDYGYMVKRWWCTPSVGTFIHRDRIGFGLWRDPSIQYMVTDNLWRNPQFCYIADYEHWLRLGLFTEFKRMPYVLATHRRHQGQITNSPAIAKERAWQQVSLNRHLFSRPDIPPHIKRLERESKGFSYYTAGLTALPDKLTFLKYITLAAIVCPEYLPKEYTMAALGVGIRELKRRNLWI